MCQGIETLTTNMLGSAVNDNFLKIFTPQKNPYNFIISAKKNGDYEKISYWLKMSLPIEVETRKGELHKLSRRLLNLVSIII